MNRRFFLKTVGLGSIGLASAGYLMDNSSLLPETNVVPFTPKELKTALTQYINRYFNGDLFNPSKPLPSGGVTAVSGFEIEPVAEKNTIFDFSDLVIEQCKEVGFDATSLKEGIIPTGMQVNSDSYKIITSAGVHGKKIEGLKDYDASIKYYNPVFIKTTLPPDKWNTLGEFKKAFENKKIITFRDKKGKIMISKLLTDNSTPIKVVGIKPNIAFAPNQTLRFPISYDVVKPFLNTPFFESIIKD